MKFLSILLIAILLGSCSPNPLLTDKAVGEEKTKLDHKEWEGVWELNNNGKHILNLYHKILDTKLGKSVIFIEGQVPIYLEFRNSGEVRFISCHTDSFKVPSTPPAYFTEQNFSYSNKGKKTTLSSKGKDIFLHEEGNSKPTEIFTGHTSEVHCVSFSFDRSEIISNTTDTVNIWDTASGKLIKSIKDLGKDLRYVYFRPDGKQFLIAGRKKIYVMDSSTFKVLFTINDERKQDRLIRYSYDGKRIVSMDWPAYYHTGVLSPRRSWDAKTGKSVKRKPKYFTQFHLFSSTMLKEKFWMSVKYKKVNNKLIIYLVDKDTFKKPLLSVNEDQHKTINSLFENESKMFFNKLNNK